VINDSNKIILEQDMITKVKSKVYFDFLSRFFCGVGFKFRQMKGSDLTSTHSTTPLQLLMGSFTFDKLLPSTFVTPIFNDENRMYKRLMCALGYDRTHK
jgi:hypothetical protein